MSQRQVNRPATTALGFAVLCGLAGWWGWHHANDHYRKQEAVRVEVTIPTTTVPVVTATTTVRATASVQATGTDVTGMLTATGSVLGGVGGVVGGVVALRRPRRRRAA